MPPFRRRFRRTIRRRSPYELVSLVQCRSATTIVLPSTCTSPFTNAFLVAGTTLAAGDEPQRIGEKGIVFGGCHFQLEHSINPRNQPEGLQNHEEFIEIFEALVVLPYAQGTPGVPVYLPFFTNGFFQTRQAADRVLWKRITIMPYWGTNTLGGTSQLQTTIRDVGHGPIQVKAKARLDDRHGLFYCANYVSGVSSGFGNYITAVDGWFRSAIRIARK